LLDPLWWNGSVALNEVGDDRFLPQPAETDRARSGGIRFGEDRGGKSERKRERRLHCYPESERIWEERIVVWRRKLVIETQENSLGESELRRVEKRVEAESTKLRERSRDADFALRIFM
jgi:hypothetical protein